MDCERARLFDHDQVSPMVNAFGALGELLLTRLQLYEILSTTGIYSTLTKVRERSVLIFMHSVL